MTEQKTGHPLRGLDISPELLTNGSIKKDEEPPAVVEPPAAISEYFDGAYTAKILRGALIYAYVLQRCRSVSRRCSRARSYLTNSSTL